MTLQRVGQGNGSLYVRCADCRNALKTNDREGVWFEIETQRYVCCPCVKERARKAAAGTLDAVAP
jgi:hypothetical protein